MRAKPLQTISLALFVLLLVFTWLILRTNDRRVVDRNVAAHREEVLVDDTAGLLTLAQRERIVAFHTAILHAYDIDYRVATRLGDFDLNLSAAELFADLRIGALSDQGRGLLLLVAPDLDQVRIEVGRGLEPVFTDAFVAYIEHRQMVPFFEGNRVADGILATTELIADRAEKGTKTAAFADPEDGAAEPSTGAGARADARIGAGYERPAGGRTDASPKGLHPDEVVAAYLTAMDAGNANPDLGIFTAETRKMMRNWVVTPAQMKQISRTYRGCGPSVVFQTSARAIVRYAARDRACAPFFLRRTEDVWQIDLTVMSNAIRFDHRNRWRFSSGPPPEFAFAFDDWRFDRNGYPREAGTRE